MSRKEIPYQFTDEKKEGKRIITLSGVIRKRYWDGDKCIDAKLLRDALDGAEEDIVIRLNSNGGDVFEGVEMYTYIKDHPKHITVEVTGIAASAATFIVSGADTAIMNVGTTYMVHEAETLAWGNKSQLKKTLDALETIDQSILNIYTDRTGQTAEQIKEWMDAAKWFTADEAVKYGFADEVKVKRDVEDGEKRDIIALVNQAVSAQWEQFQRNYNHNTVQPKSTGQKSLLNKLRKGE